MPTAFKTLRLLSIRNGNRLLGDRVDMCQVRHENSLWRESLQLVPSMTDLTEAEAKSCACRTVLADQL